MAKKKKEPKNKSVERKVYYYKVTCKCDGTDEPINSLFDAYIKLYDNNGNNLEDRGLAIPFYDKFHFLEVFQHEYDKDIYQGKFYSLRATDFPYLFNLLSGNRQEIPASDDDTLMEQTHFCYIVNKNLLVSEYNFHGARIERLANYLVSIMGRLQPSKNYEVSIEPIIMPDYYTRIANCRSLSKLQFKVAKPGLKMLKDFGIINGYDILADEVQAGTDFYIDIEVSGGGKGSHVPVSNLPAFLQKIINMIKKSKEVELEAEDGSNPIFSKAKLRGLDSDAGKIIPYDLLDEKLVQNEWVEKVSNRSKYVDSDKMFAAILKAYREQKDTALKYMEKM